MNVLYDFDDGKYMANFLFNDTLCKVVMVKGDPGEPTDAQVKTAVYEYLEEHPNTFNPEGEYEDFTAGNANQLTSNIYTEDTTPYIYRAVPEGAGNREIVEQITGGTVAWNQLIHNGNFVDTTYWSKASTATFSVSNNVGTFKAAARYHNLIAQSLPNMVSGHVYMGLIDAQSYTNSNTIFCVRRDSGSSYAQTVNATLSTTMNQKAVMLKASDEGITRFFIQDNNESGWGEIKVKNAMLIDLTQMFGSTIADYIYNLETATTGAGVNLFKSLFPKAFYAYNAGELMSVKTSAHETVGKNLFAPYTRSDSSAGGVTWSYQGDSFTARGTATGTSYASLIGNNWQTVEGSIFGNVLGKQITISGGKDGIYMNLAFRRNSSDSGYQTNWVTRGTITVPTDGSYQVYFNARVTSGWSGEATIQPQVELGSAATDYIPYEKHTYPLSDIELRGIPKLVNNKLQYDGDIYKADGSVTRKYGIRAYQSGDATGDTMITDGTNTVYQLSSPTTETTTPYTETQICSLYGTESFVDGRDVQIPVGHKTKYPTDQVKKLDGLPSDFSTLIAPTESGTASRNYSVGSFLIMNNQLYKVTSAIASGAAIAVGTNVTATTLAEQIIALLNQ